MPLPPIARAMMSSKDARAVRKTASFFSDWNKWAPPVVFPPMPCEPTPGHMPLQGRRLMPKRTLFAAVAGVAALASMPVLAQTPAPTFATTKVEGTDNVYIFRYQNHQAMFIVTPAGVIATDPISYGRPQAAKTYIE